MMMMMMSEWKTWLTGRVCVLLPSARDADEREKWIHALEGTILRHTLQLRVCNRRVCARVPDPSNYSEDKKINKAVLLWGSLSLFLFVALLTSLSKYDIL